jgi:hypothetical protein
MNTSASQFVGWTAVIGGALGVLGFVSLMLMFVVGEPFGAINDFLSIPTGLLLLTLVFGLFRLQAAYYPLAGVVAALLGAAGFMIIATGSALLQAGRIPFERSLVLGLGGFGLIGLWMLINSVLFLSNGLLPRSLAWAGVLLGLTPALSLVFMLRADAIAANMAGMAGQATAGFQINPLVIVFIGLGVLSYAGLPVWYIAVGRLFLSPRLGALVSPLAGS